MNEITIKTPAKINFGLSVINKRNDGFHNIETIFYPINLFDVITFKKSTKLSFNSDNELLNSEADNLILKAVKLLAEYTNTQIHVDIFLEKNIPIGAGMGGGSSDAAATLNAINILYDFKLPHNILKILSLQLGSDVPFFIDPKPVYAESRGEVMKDINFKISNPILIVYPGLHVSTKWAYENIEPQNPNEDLFDFVLKEADFYKYKNRIQNMFEEVVFNKYPEIKSIKEKMYSEGAMFSLMTGSGSTVFGIFPDLISAIKTKGLFNEKIVHSFTLKISAALFFLVFFYGCSSSSEVSITPRSDWKAVEPKPFKTHVPTQITIHHEGVIFTDSMDAPSHIKNVQVWGMGPDRNWVDIPYHFLISLDGSIYEGRNVYTVGETNTEYDPTGHLLISCLGNFEEQEVPEAQLNSLINLIAYCSKKYQIPSETIASHKDHSKQTSCPGKNLYQYLENGYIKAQVKQLLN